MAPDDIPGYCDILGFRILNLDAESASTYHTLHRIAEHRDPFDRLLVHQCIRQRATLVTRDSRLAHYESYGLARPW